MLLTIALLMASCDCLPEPEPGPREPRGRNRFWVATTFNAAYS